MSRPANTVGGDFYDILPLDDGRVVVAVGDVAGKGSPAALLMALLLAMMRTLVDEKLEAAELVTRLNMQVCRHAPGSRFITLFYAVFEPSHRHAHLRERRTHAAAARCARRDVRAAVGRRHRARHVRALDVHDRQVLLQPAICWRSTATASPRRRTPPAQPFDEIGLETALKASARNTLADIGGAVVRAVERHTDDKRFADDLTILLLRRTAAA